MAITFKELCLALVYDFKQYYLRNSSFTAVVDHQALLSLLSQKEPVGKFASWVAFLQQFNFNTVHRPGKDHSSLMPMHCLDVNTSHLMKVQIRSQAKSKIQATALCKQSLL